MQPIYLYRASDEIDPTAHRVDRFPAAPKSVFTVAQHTADFVGTVRIEASIASEPSDSDWFIAWEQSYTPLDIMEERSRNRSMNLNGRFIWMRVIITPEEGRTRGSVDRVTVI